MNPKIEAEQDNRPKQIKTLEMQDNKELAQKGRFVVGVSFLLALHSQEFVKLNKLPFIGGSIEHAEPKI